MSFWRSGSSAREALAQVTAPGKSQAVIEFNLDGTIITANQNFLDAVGYRLDEIKGNHHSMFVVPEEPSSPAYREFWAKLGRGRRRRQGAECLSARECGGDDAFARDRIDRGRSGRGGGSAGAAADAGGGI